MPLTGQQILRLAVEIDRQMNLPSLELLATDLGVNLANLAPAGSVKERALTFITHMSTRYPPRDAEVLQALRAPTNAALQALAEELLRPPFFSPTGDPHDAILLGRTAFVARSELRTALREFTTPTLFSTRVLMVRGDEPGGKSYSWRFLQHLASVAGARAMHLRLEGTNYTPRQLFEQIFRLLRLDVTRLPTLSDDPQQARIDALINAFKGEIAELPSRYWLVIDDLNDPGVTPAIRESVFAIVCTVEDQKPENLWLALLGYNEEIVNLDLRHIQRDDAAFPSAEAVATHFESIAVASPRPLSSPRAREIADALFQKLPPRNKAAMNQLTVLVENAGEKIRLGQQP